MLDCVRNSQSHRDDRVHIAGRRSDIVGDENLTHDVTRVGYRETRVHQLVDEATGAQRSRRQVLPGVVSAGAGRDADNRQRQGHQTSLARSDYQGGRKWGRNPRGRLAAPCLEVVDKSR